MSGHADLLFLSGNYSTSCSNCSFVAIPKKTITLSCLCQDDNKHTFNSSLDLSNVSLWQVADPAKLC